MSVLAILADPDPRLRQMALPVESYDDELRGFIADLIETLRHHGGIGLSATQVDRHQRIAVVDLSAGSEPAEIYVNPQISPGKTIGLVEESCLSVPGVVANVRRPIELTVRACDALGQPFERQLEGMRAVCLHHELDHLNGRLFIDRLPWWQRLMLKRRRAASQAASSK